MYNPNWYYNPQVFNQETYLKMQQEMQKYLQSQNEEVSKAFHAYKDFLDSISKLDSAHQQELCYYCMAEFFNINRYHQ